MRELCDVDVQVNYEGIHDVKNSSINKKIHSFIH